jgi:nicotinamidase-related amidase
VVRPQDHAPPQALPARGAAAPITVDQEDLVDASRTAVVLIEYQNDFTSEGGALHGAVQASMEATGMLGNTREVIDAARPSGATIIHAPIQFAAGYGEITDHPYGILKGVVDSTAFVKGSWGASIVPDVAPADGDIVLEGKRGLDAFASTNLDFILRSKGITTIALGGFLTNCCVESTMRSAYERGYEVITLTDCVAGTSAEEHENAIKFDYPMFSKPMTGREFAATLGGGGSAEDASRGY